MQKEGPMAKAKSAPKKDEKSKNPSAAVTLDIVFVGPLLFVPAVDAGKIANVEVFSPCNGHHIGAVFLPGVIFSDAELDDPKCERWPEPETFSLLDPHSYTIALTQKKRSKQPTLPVSAIPDTNHKVKPERRLSSDWTVAIMVSGQLSMWTSHRLAKVRDGLLHGADAPTAEFISAMHRLRYEGVVAAELCGAATEPRAYLRSNIGKGGTLIVIGEIPYQSTLRHEREAIDAMAKLAGLELHLAEMAPSPFQSRLMNHVQSCGLSVVLV